MNSGDLHKVWEVRALKRKPAAEEAQKMLEKIAKQVQPIMRKHKWRVKLLCEFCPSNPGLLGVNVNGGVSVKLRLRRPNRDFDFYPYDQVLDTMLHELCHNAHGPHNANFYKLWDELRKECEELMSKGISGTGDGFDLPGRRLGGFSRQPPMTSLRKTALAAAEKRAKLGLILPSGPKRLGGDSNIMDALTPVQAAAMAAERRLQDDIWCASQLVEVSDDEDEEACDVAKDSSSSIGQSSRGSNLIKTGKKRSLEARETSSYPSSAGLSEPCLSNFSKSEARLVHASNSNIKSETRDTDDPAMWECGMCTLLNPPLAPLCKLCSTERPSDDGNKYKSWCCRFCTLENNMKLDKCSACDQWRYSYGAPLSTHAPYKVSAGESILALVGTERSARHIFYVVAEELVQPYGAESSIHAGFKWRSRREVVDWLTSMLSKQNVQELQKCDLGHALKSQEFPGTSFGGQHTQAQSFVFVMKIEDRRGQKKVKVRWFHHNQEVNGVVRLRSAHPKEIFITPYSQAISAECVDGPANVLAREHYEECVASISSSFSARIHSCFRQFRCSNVKPFDLSKLRSYIDQPILSCLSSKRSCLRTLCTKDGSILGLALNFFYGKRIHHK